MTVPGGEAQLGEREAPGEPFGVRGRDDAVKVTVDEQYGPPERVLGAVSVACGLAPADPAAGAI
ncbi:MAG: hypothetical protein JWM19_5080 [Actinomycetia bacterium]|nr:hypothetical protein [Actinomycetes bacterium]